MILFDNKLFLGVRSFSVKNIYAGKKKTELLVLHQVQFHSQS